MEIMPVDPIDEIFEKFKASKSDNSLELFAEGDVTLKTDLINKEMVLVNALHVENKLIKESLGFDVFGEFLSSFKRHKVSLDRKSRSEFVDVNLRNSLDRDISRASNLKNLVESRN